jgi:4-nitrophenyl phosphatase
MLKAVLLDLDGTVYLGDAEVPGASDLVRYCGQRGLRCLFVTNRSNRPPEVIRDQLRGYGVPCETEDVLTSAQATARYLGKGSVYMIGEEGLERALVEQGIRITDDRPDAVVVSYDRQFSYDKLAKACRLIGNGARFIATNPDHRLRVHGQTLPGTGAIVAAVATGSGVLPEVVGKPERLIFSMALETLGCRADEAISVGDNIDTDIGASAAAGIPSVLLLTGVSRREDVVDGKPRPDYVEENFAGLTHLLERLA